MKKYLFLMLVILISFIAMNATAFDIGITVNDVDYPEFKAAFLKSHPNDECLKYDLTTMTCLQKRFTDDEWVRERTRRFTYEAFRSGQESIVKDLAIKNMDRNFDGKVMLKNTTVMPVIK